MEDELKFWLTLWIAICVTICVVVLSICSCVYYSNRAAFENGYEEIRVPSQYTTVWQKKPVEKEK